MKRVTLSATAIAVLLLGTGTAVAAPSGWGAPDIVLSGTDYVEISGFY